MIPLIEVKYIAIKWHDENSVLKIEEEIIPTTSLEVEDEKTYNLELQAYKRILEDKYFISSPIIGFILFLLHFLIN